MKDEPFPGHYGVNEYVSDLIQNATQDTFGTAIKGLSVTYTSQLQSYGHTYMDIVNPELLVVDIYPFMGDCSGYPTRYTGSEGGPDYHGLQYNLNNCTVTLTDWVRDFANEYNCSWWIAAQLFAGRDSTQAASGCDWFWRWPTASELSCESFITLCYKPDGLLYWKQSSWWTTAGGVSWGNCGLYDTTLTTVKQDLFDELKNDINPYIKAIDSVYLGLEWVAAASVWPNSAPDVDLISSLKAVSNNPDSTSPDLGWFNIGVFQDNNDDYYFMLVNRACNDTLGNEAPSVTATVWLNRDKVGSDFIRVIDIAKTIKRDDQGNWIGIPDTVRTGIAKNRAIPYVTVLRAGEGRLYRIIPVSN